MTTPDHVENTGDNLRHAAEAQEQSETNTPPEQSAPETPLPDFNT